MTEEDMSGKRKVYIDIIRIIAIIMVLWNHRYTYWGVNAESDWLVLKSIAAFWCKMGAPLFLMVSGELLLGKDESFKYIITHRVLRIVVVMIILTLMKSLNYLTVSNVLEIFLTGLNWYLYAYIGWLFMLPFLRKIARYTSTREKIIYIGLVSLLYMADSVKTLTCKTLLGNFTDFTSIYWSEGTHGLWQVVYPLIGFFTIQLLKDKSILKRNFLLIFLVVGSGVSLFLSVCLYIRDLKLNGANYEMLRQDFIVLPCILMYVVIYKMCQNLRVKAKTIISEIASCTFGVFLLETNTDIKALWIPAIKTITSRIGIDNYCFAVIEIVISFILYTGIIWVIRRISVVRKIL